MNTRIRVRQPVLSQRIGALQRRWFSIFLLNLSVYIASLNSFALFVLYPAMKHHRAGIALLVYFFISAPVMLYGLIVARQSHRDYYGLVGFVLVLIVAALRILMTHDAVGPLVASTFVYLLTAFVEESLWRGLLWRAIQAQTKSRLQTYGYVTLHFAVLHVPFAVLRATNAATFLATVLALGAVLGGLRILGNSARLPIGVHAAVNILAKT